MSIRDDDIDLLEVNMAELALALFIRACADYRGRVDHSEGNPLDISREARDFLLGSTPEWLESKRFWVRVAGFDEIYFDEVILPRLLAEDMSPLVQAVEDLGIIRRGN